MKTRRPIGAVPSLTQQSFGPRQIFVGARPANLVVQKRTYQLITPLFGGGIEAGMPDEEHPINAKSVRGHLRFWWRVMRGGNDGTLQELATIESTMWGASATEELSKKNNGPSKVQVFVRNIRLGTVSQVYDERGRIFQDWGDISYFLFPLQPDARRAKPAGEVLEKASFELEIAFPEAYRAAVEATLWGWETFGGVGARTRRGFGALRLTALQENGRTLPVDLPVGAGDAREWILQKIRLHLKVGVAAAGVPRLIPNSAIIKFQDSSEDAGFNTLDNLAKHYKQFRQDRQRGARGRQKWPEPDALRLLAHSASRGHPPLAGNCGKFPRGQLGLPVIFHFKDTDDPRDYSLELSTSERLASPLLLKPLACQGQRGVGLAVKLALQFPEGITPLDAKLKPIGHGGASFSVKMGVTPAEITGGTEGGRALAPISPLYAQSTTNAVDAFLNSLSNLS